MKNAMLTTNRFARSSLGWTSTGRTVFLATALLFCAGLISQACAENAEPPKPLAPLRRPHQPCRSAVPNASTPGAYVEIGAVLAKALGRPFETVWAYSYFGKRTLRTGMLAGQCDFMIGLPEVEDFMGPRVIFSKPLVRDRLCDRDAQDERRGAGDAFEGAPRRGSIQHRSAELSGDARRCHERDLSRSRHGDAGSRGSQG